MIEPDFILHPEPHRLLIIIKELIPILGRPNPHIFIRAKLRSRKQILLGNPNIIEEIQSDPDTTSILIDQFALTDFSLERPEDDEAEFGVDVDATFACALRYEAFGGTEDVPEADAKSDSLDYFVGVFCVYVVFEGVFGGFAEVPGVNLDYVLEFYLQAQMLDSSLFRGFARRAPDDLLSMLFLSFFTMRQGCSLSRTRTNIVSAYLWS